MHPEILLWLKISDAWTIFQGEINEIFQEYLKLIPEFVSTDKNAVFRKLLRT